ncbi:pentapeptide repeat-containing protein [Methylobacterium currus]|uniref:Pentapeptide repeat-containing protein n=1 Tax=Methylobacterium currus TaxID=2051553 RepID=A0A2R4WHP2_9HYPH|nr:pentapeptide repeat-containing protein [Methylobacterium currus]AWB21045.1 pentapeptide repeat-containing protein [Methylobacterium currus]UHC14122.1 pentapeptide repeat-containing protein [Methylobacterium currus]
MNSRPQPPLDPRVGALLAEIAAQDGAALHRDGRPLDLRAADLSRARLAPLAGDAAWWDADRQGLNLAGAEIAGSDLEQADLTGATLKRARLTGAMARSADFSAALIEEADFGKADLSGARFTGVAGGQADFTEAMLEDASFRDAALRFARLPRSLLDGADFSGADLWGADFTGADADYTRFRGARLDEVNLSDTNLTHADFEGASLTKARLAGSRLRSAKLSGAKLDGADLSGADLSAATLVRLDLSSCSLRHARFAGAWLNGTRFRAAQIGEAVGEEVDGDYEAAKASYLALEQNFESIGSRDEAGWAYRRRRRMGRLHAGVQFRNAWRDRDRGGVLRHGYRWLADRFVEWLCDYGESLSRLFRAFAVLIVVFAGLFGLAGGLIPEGSGAPTYNALDLLSYSALNMMTANPPEIGIKPVGRFTNLLVGVQGGTGIVLMGLFGFVLGNRLRR